jgi:hypothetical protein
MQLRYLLTSFPKLYASELHKLTVCLIGECSLCNFIKPVILGGVGLIHFNLHFSCMMLLLLIVCFTCFL